METLEKKIRLNSLSLTPGAAAKHILDGDFMVNEDIKEMPNPLPDPQAVVALDIVEGTSLKHPTHADAFVAKGTSYVACLQVEANPLDNSIVSSFD